MTQFTFNERALHYQTSMLSVRVRDRIPVYYPPSNTGHACVFIPTPILAFMFGNTYLFSCISWIILHPSYEIYFVCTLTGVRYIHWREIFSNILAIDLFMLMWTVFFSPIASAIEKSAIILTPYCLFGAQVFSLLLRLSTDRA